LLFNLQQHVELYDLYCQKIADCDVQIEAHLQTLERKLV